MYRSAAPVYVDRDAGAGSWFGLVQLQVLDLSNIFQQHAVQLLQAKEPWHGRLLKHYAIFKGGGGYLKI